MVRLVVVGESLVDIVHDQDGGSTSAVGGSPMNVAVGLARLDVPVLLITQIGDDEHGLSIAEHVHSSGAELSPSSVYPGRRTSTATARLGAGNKASYDFDLTWDLSAQELPTGQGLHVGSLGASIAPGRSSVLDLTRRAANGDRFVSFDPNVRPTLMPDPGPAWMETAELASLSTLVKVSDEDLAFLRPGEPVDSVARELLAGDRTELVIVTRGDAGASALSEHVEVAVATPLVDVVDTVGAGDSFMAAALAVLWDWQILATTPGGLSALGDDHMRTLLGGATEAAAMTCSRRGANPPTRQELPSAWPGVAR